MSAPAENGLAVAPECLEAYLANVAGGRPMREIARVERCEPSTIMRRVRRVEELRDSPEWDAILTALEAHRNRQHVAPKGMVGRDQIVAALGLTAEKVHAEFAAAAQVLMRPGGVMLVGDMPMAAACGEGGTRATVAREIMLAALAFGWLTATGRSDGKVRRYLATESVLQCAAPPAPAPEAEGAAPTRPGRVRYSAGESPVEALLRRKDQTLVTVEHLALAREFHGLYIMRESAIGHVYGEVSAALPPRVLELLAEVCGEQTGFETAERKLGLPARSAKAILAYALDTYAHVKGTAA